MLKLNLLYSICISGFDKKTLSVNGLEEYWPYKFKVNAATVKGNKTSDFSSVFRTKQAGKLLVFNFSSCFFYLTHYIFPP